jgi:hypothetical protein
MTNCRRRIKKQLGGDGEAPNGGNERRRQLKNERKNSRFENGHKCSTHPLYMGTCVHTTLALLLIRLLLSAFRAVNRDASFRRFRRRFRFRWRSVQFHATVDSLRPRALPSHVETE